MEKKLITVSEKSNIELNEESLEMLMHGVCKSFECEDFRANNCRMKAFINSIEDGSWRWSQTWMTPTKFFLHLIKYDVNSSDEINQMIAEMKEQWECPGDLCSCEFFEEMKQLRAALIKTVSITE